MNMLLGENGIIERAKQEKEQTLIAQYKEQIELVKVETRLEYGSEFTLDNLKTNFDRANQKSWVNNTIKITDNGTEKIQLTTNDTYIFYVTKETTEYKGKNGQIIQDTSVVTISANPSNKTDDTVSSITINITVDDTENITSSTGSYAWSQSSSATISTWSPLTLTNSGDKQATGSITSSQATDGDWYLYVKAVINGKETEPQHFGVYKFQANPTANDNLVCESITELATETTLTLRLGSNKAFEGWKVTYTITNGEDTIVDDEEITAGTTISNVTATKGDIIVVKYSRIDGTGTAVTRTLDTADYNLKSTAEMIQYTRTWGTTSITNVKQALEYLETKFPSSN